MLVAVAAVFMIAFGCNAGSPWTQVAQECTSIVRHPVLRAAVGYL